jgi:hypothetical protein
MAVAGTAAMRIAGAGDVRFATSPKISRAPPPRIQRTASHHGAQEHRIHALYLHGPHLITMFAVGRMHFLHLVPRFSVTRSRRSPLAPCVRSFACVCSLQRITEALFPNVHQSAAAGMVPQRRGVTVQSVIPSGMCRQPIKYACLTPLKFHCKSRIRKAQHTTTSRSAVSVLLRHQRSAGPVTTDPCQRLSCYGQRCSLCRAVAILARALSPGCAGSEFPTAPRGRQGFNGRQ